MVPHPAREADIESLTTIIPRSFDKDAFLNILFPPTSTLIKDWWAEVYTKAIASPACRILVETLSDKVIGVLTLHFWDPNNPTSTPEGICTFAPFTSDHNEIMPTAIESQTRDRKKLMRNTPNFMIDLMAVDKDYQGCSVGHRLLQRACRIADEHDAAIFLQTTKARKYYLTSGLGFESEEGDEEGIVIRPVSKK